MGGDRLRSRLHLRRVGASGGLAWLCALAVCAWVVGGVGWAEERDEWQQPNRVMADLSLAPGMCVADVGCGEGYFTFRLAEAVGEGGRVSAVDIDADAIGSVRRQAEKGHLANVQAMVSEPTDTKLQSGSVDVALLCDVLHEAGPKQRAPLVRDIARALKPGGFLFIVDYRKVHEVPFDPYEQLIPREDLVRLGEEAGLTLDAEFHYLKYQVFLRLRKPAQP